MTILIKNYLNYLFELMKEKLYISLTLLSLVNTDGFNLNTA